MPLSPAALTARDPLERFRHLAVVSGTERPIPLASTRFSVHVLGAMALVTTERAFRNAEAQSIEATMTFPVPVHAALVGLSARIADRKIVATARRKAKARGTYEAAVDGGRTAVLHEEALRGVHMISVGHVPPGQEVTVAAVWAMPLAAAGEAARLVIPTTVGEIYGRSPLSDSDDLAHAPVRHEADVEVSCEEGFAQLVGGRLVDGRARVTLDRPIEILVTGCPARVLHGVAADGRTVELTFEPAGGEADLDCVLLEDVSGSMNEAATGPDDDRGRAPSKHDIAMRGLRDLTSGLRAADGVEVWEFNDVARRVGAGVGPEGIGCALAMVHAPSGGTEIGAAIGTVLAEREEADVLLVTDGKSHALDVHALARAGARFTVVLVGEDSLEANVGHLAALTGGQVFVSSGPDLPEVLGRAVTAMRAARLHQRRIPGSASLEKAETLSGGMHITARWRVAAKPEVAGAVSGDAGVGRAVAAYAAWLALPLMDEEDAASLAEAEGVVCHLTSLVLVDEAGEAQEGIPAQRKVPLMAPRTMDILDVLDVACAVTPMPPSQRVPHVARRSTGTRSVVTLKVGAMPPKSRSAEIQVEMMPPRAGVGPLPASAPTRAATPFNLGALRGRVSWAGDLQALRRGELQGNVPPETLIVLRAAAQVAEVAALAAALGVAAEVVGIALLARAEGVSDRGAARLARAVLGAADEAMVEAAAHAVGL